MKKFDKIYKNIVDENVRAKESKIENDFRKVYETLLSEWDIVSVDNLSENDKKAFNASLNKLWTVESGITNEGKQFIDDRHMFLTESSTDIHRKNYLKNIVNKELNNFFINSKIKERIYECVDDVYKQVKANSLSETITYESLESVIIEQVNKEVKKYFEPLLEELKKQY